MEDAIRFENVTFKYNDNAPLIDKLSFTIPKGQYTVLLGHNGSGKSTIAKLIVGLLEYEDGKIFIDDDLFDIKNDNESKIDEIRSKIAIVFQNPDNQFIGTTVEDDIAFGLENKCVPQSDMHDIIVEYATKVGMENYLKSEPTQLSGGQKQRVALAGVLALSPEILILDEATSMLDPKGRQDIKNLIKDIKNKNQNMTIISITHHIEEALDADNIIILNKGKVVASGTPSDILYDTKLLEDNLLIAPFVVSLTKKLQDEGIKIDKSFSIDELVNKL